LRLELVEVARHRLLVDVGDGAVEEDCGQAHPLGELPRELDRLLVPTRRIVVLVGEIVLDLVSGVEHACVPRRRGLAPRIGATRVGPQTACPDAGWPSTENVVFCCSEAPAPAPKFAALRRAVAAVAAGHRNGWTRW